MQFSLQKKDQKKESEFIQTIIPVDGLCYKMNYLSHQFYQKFFHLSQNVYHATEKQLRQDKKNGQQKQIVLQLRLSYNICLLVSCVFDDKTD